MMIILTVTVVANFATDAFYRFNKKNSHKFTQILSIIYPKNLA